MNSFMGWIGGKRLLRKVICEQFPKNTEKYVEPFGGAAWVLFFKDKHADCEVYNDINSNLVNLFRCVKYHPDELTREMEYLPNSREIFNGFRNKDRSGMTDIQRAAEFLYLIKISYGSKLRTYGARPRRVNCPDGFSDVAERLSNVIIENKSFNAVIKQYDGTGTLFYCDPPYYGTEGYYEENGYKFGKNEHEVLRNELSRIKGKFILSYNDCPEIRELYLAFTIETTQRQNNLASRHGADKIYRELIIKNY